MELDLYWMTLAKHDPLKYFEQYPGRFALCHVKDMDASGAFADVGSGTMDFKAIFARSEQAGFKHYIVEHDRPESPLASIQASSRYLTQLRF
jgi:sugar phosphate isomerase/epimerase